MKLHSLSRRALRLRPWWVPLVLGCLALAPVRRAIDRKLSSSSENTHELYVSSGEVLRQLGLGYEGLLADIYWTRVVQYYGRQRIAKAGRFDLLGQLLGITTTLDPHLIIAYRFGAIFLAGKPPGGAGQPEQALQLLRRGIVANPEYWRLWQDLGFVYYWDLQDYAGAARAFQAGSERPGAQVWMKTLAAMVATKGGETQSSRLLWWEIYRQAENDAIRKSALEHLAALTAQEQIQKLNELLDCYQRKAGHVARSFRELVAAGLLPTIPFDPSGIPYLVNPAGRAGLAPTSRIDLRLLP